MKNAFGSGIVSLLIGVSTLWASQAPGSAAVPFQGLLGMSLRDAQKTDFFTFFHLQETGRESDDAKRAVVVFKPEGEAFRKLVTVRTTLNAAGRIVQMDLYLARSFINDRNKRPFANDIAKSVLFGAPPPADRASLQTLVDEIFSHRGVDTPVLTGQSPPETPVKLSPGYLTYLGKRYLYSQDLSGSRLHMENVKQDGSDWLQIQVSLKQ